MHLFSCLGGLKAYGAKECLLLQCLSLQETASIALSYSTDAIEKNLLNQKETLENMGFNVETRIVTGLVKHEINKIAIEEDYSIIVVGAEKHSMSREIFLRGLAYDVIHYAKKPVLLIRLEGNPKEGLECIKAIGCNIGNSILFPTDFSENADIAFNYLLKMVSGGAKKVTILHVQDKSRIHPHLEDKLDKFNEIDTTRLENLKKNLQEQGNVDVEIILKYGSPSVEILRLIDEFNIQLVVMGSQGRGFVNELFLGSVSHNVARLSSASVLLIPAKRVRE